MILILCFARAYTPLGVPNRQGKSTTARKATGFIQIVVKLL
jgi:hypothetical protein